MLGFSVAIVNVLDPDDVVLSQIASRLHFDQFEVDLAGIGQPVIGADRQVDQLVFVHELHDPVQRHLGGPAHHDPVLGAVIVLLQRQPAAWPHDDPLDLVARAPVDALIIAPGAVHAAVPGRLRLMRPLELLDQLLDLVRLSLVGDQDRIAGRHDNHVVEPDHGGQMLFRAHEQVCRIDRHRPAAQAVAVRVLRAQPPHRRPLSDVRPADVGLEHRRAARSLHHRIVDRGALRLGEGVAVQNDKAEILLGEGDGLGGRRGDLWARTGSVPPA